MLGVVLCVTGCGGGGSSYFAYREAGFEAVIEGELEGQAFVAEIKSDPVGTSYIRYRAPASLAGVCVELTREGAVCMRLNGLSYVADTETLAGLLRPLLSLTSSSTEVRSVQKDRGGTVLALSDGVTLSLSAKGLPVRVRGARFDFAVTEWKSAK